MEQPKRNHLSKLALTVVVVLLAAPTCLAALFVFAPKNFTSERWSAIASVGDVPDDGIPHRFQSKAVRYNAWNLDTRQTVDHVYLRRKEDGRTIVALRAYHGRLRVPIQYNKDESRFDSACWNMKFSLDGDNLDPNVAEENIENLDVKVEDGVVYIRDVGPDYKESNPVTFRKRSPYWRFSGITK